MSFLEPSFIYFIALFFVCYYALSVFYIKKVNLFVGLASFLFVAWYYPPFSIIVLFQMTIIHCLYQRMINLRAAIVLVLVPLFIFKYSAFFATMLGFTVTQLPLPIGISFYTFTAIAVMFEMERSQDIRDSYTVTGSLKILAFWPHLASGPVLRPKNMWRPYIPFRERDVILALVLIIFGLFKKVVIADGAGTAVARAMELGVANLSVLDTSYMALAMSIQIYGDFSGYSDMALGFALLVGVQLPANFNFPYLADSVTDFWKRWHISLTSWFRDYLYIPLGGNRKGSVRTYVNMFTVFLVSGLWHGAAINFVLWGALHGFLLVLEKYTGFNRLPSLIRRIIVLPIIIFSWLVFFIDTEGLLTIFDIEILARENNPEALGSGVLLFAFLLMIEHIFQPYRVNAEGFPERTRFGIIAAPFVLLLASMYWSEPLPFIYFDF
jgi:alginate O-acetyltransferase complex protein AlgI